MSKQLSRVQLPRAGTSPFTLDYKTWTDLTVWSMTRLGISSEFLVTIKLHLQSSSKVLIQLSTLTPWVSCMSLSKTRHLATFSVVFVIHFHRSLKYKVAPCSPYHLLKFKFSTGRHHGTPDMMSPLTNVTSSPSNHVTSPNSHVTSQHQYQMSSSQQHVATSPQSGDYESPHHNRSSTLGRNGNSSVLPHMSYQVRIFEDAKFYI